MHRKLVAAHAGQKTPAVHDSSEARGDLLQHDVADRVAMDVVDRLESIEVQHANRERGVRGRWISHPVAEQDLKMAAIGEPSEVVGVGHLGRGEFGFLRQLALLRDHRAGSNDFAEYPKILLQHVDQETGNNQQQRDQRVQKLVAERQKRRDKRQRGGENDERRGTRQGEQAERAGDDGDPDGEHHHRLLVDIAAIHGSDANQREAQRQRRPENRGGAHILADDGDVHIVDALAGSHPVPQSRDDDAKQDANGSDCNAFGRNAVQLIGQQHGCDDDDRIENRNETGERTVLFSQHDRRKGPIDLTEVQPGRDLTKHSSVRLFANHLSNRPPWSAPGR